MKTRIKKETRFVNGVEEVTYKAQAFSFPEYLTWHDIYDLHPRCDFSLEFDEGLFGGKRGTLEFAKGQIDDFLRYKVKEAERESILEQRKKVTVKYITYP